MLVKLVDPALETSNSLNTDHETSGPGLDTSIVKKANENSSWVLDSVQLSYRNPDNPQAPIAGQLIVLDGEKVKLDMWITSTYEVINVHIMASPLKDLTITLKTGGDGVIGKLNTQTHLEAEF